MRKFRRGILPLLCLCLMLGVTACGSRDDMNNQAPSDNNSMNNATENTQGNTTGQSDNMQSTDRNENSGVVDQMLYPRDLNGSQENVYGCVCEIEYR